MTAVTFKLLAITSMLVFLIRGFLQNSFVLVCCITWCVRSQDVASLYDSHGLIFDAIRRLGAKRWLRTVKDNRKKRPPVR